MFVVVFVVFGVGDVKMMVVCCLLLCDVVF